MRYYLRNPFFQRVVLLAFLDWACLALAGMAAWWITAPPLPETWLAAGVVGVGLACFLALQVTGAYDLVALAHPRRTLNAVLATMGIGLAAALTIYFAIPVTKGVTPLLAHTAALYVPLLLVERKLFRTFSHRLERRLVIIGVSDLSRALVEAVRARPGIGLRVAGILTDDLGFAEVDGVPVLGKIHELEKILHDGRADGVVVASKSRSEHFPADQLLNLKFRGVSVTSGIDLYERITGEIYLRDLRASHLIFSRGFRLGPVQRACKRGLDVGLATLGLVVSAPLLLLAAAAIKLESRGPVFFRQLRLGQHNQTFHVVKLRSMTHEAERDTGAVFASHDDPRVTRVGRFLRRTRIDELPQCWNVLKGEMSIVGPRPERPEFVALLSERYPYFPLRTACKPGLTGWAQCRYGYVGEVDGFEQKIALDLYYLKHRSLSLDLSIIWTTVRTVFSLSGM